MGMHALSRGPLMSSRALATVREQMSASVSIPGCCAPHTMSLVSPWLFPSPPATPLNAVGSALHLSI